VLVAALLAWLTILFNLSSLHAQGGAAPEWPHWLNIPVEWKAEKSESPGLVSLHYQVKDKADEAAKKLSEFFAAAKLPYAPQADGIGLSAKVAAAECDLLLQFHPTNAGTQVSIHCAAKSAMTNDFYIPPVGRVSRSMPPRVADFERDRRRTMARYDQPQAASSIPFYNDDAPALHWPAWLGRLDGQPLARPERQQKDRKACLVSRYTTSGTPMSDLVYGYEDLLEANGFRVPTMNLQTGSTWNGKIVQNKSGRVEASLSADGSVNGPSTKVQANFNRSVLNGPISVYLEVCVQGSFGRR
jgi:hypothetical protein